MTNLTIGILFSKMVQQGLENKNYAFNAYGSKSSINREELQQSKHTTTQQQSSLIESWEKNREFLIGVWEKNIVSQFVRVVSTNWDT